MQDQSAYHHQIISAQFPEQGRLKCPRCESTNTKFCYYNNYNLSQPRHYCKNCRRYWTKGGALRNIPVGGGTRKPTKRSSNPKRPKPNPKMGKSLSIDGRNLDCGSTGLGQDPTRISTSKASSAVESKGQNGNGMGELESTALRMKATDHGGNGKDVDPEKNDMSRASDHGFAPVFASMEDMDTDSGVKGARRDGPGLGVGMAQFGGMHTSRGSNIGSGCEELGINYLGLRNGDSAGCWSNGKRWPNLAIYNYTHDNNPRFQ